MALRHLKKPFVMSLVVSCLLGGTAPVLASEEAGDPAAQVQVSGAWIREAPPGAQLNAGYIVLTSLLERELVLNSASSPAFELVELHDMTMTDGMMEMRELSEMRIPSKASLVLSPGGKHLMLKMPRERPVEGMHVPVVFEFENLAPLEVLFPVRRDK